MSAEIGNTYALKYDNEEELSKGTEEIIDRKYPLVEYIDKKGK